VCNSLAGTWFLILVHIGACAVLVTGTTWLDWVLFPALLLARGLTVTIGYHRYFAHRSFKTSRVMQFLLGCLCCTNLQRGPLWWAAIHRLHHRYSDAPDDPHSPVQRGLFWAHCGWMFATLEQPDLAQVSDLRRFPELVWLERFWLLPPALMVLGCWFVGGWSLVCVGFCLTNVIVMHHTFAVNSLGHVVGWARYPTADSSRNSYLLGWIALGDGWHNNHHHFPHSANHGFFRWEMDFSFTVIRLMQCLGLVWDVRGVPPHKLYPPVAPPETH
jgi:stearoyl-CoA desaturase (delta-9 desaturase)